MYEDHPNFSPPEPEAVLWRYMDFTKFVSLLDTQSLHLARADTLSDEECIVGSPITFEYAKRRVLRKAQASRPAA